MTDSGSRNLLIDLSDAILKAVEAIDERDKLLAKALKQKPCEDSIVEWKKDFKGYVNSLSMPRDDYNGTMEYIDKLPVTPQPKVGHWITTRTFMHDGEYYCDRCKCDAPNNEKWDYCPNCGANMQEVEE